MKLNMGSIQSKNGWLHLAISSKTGKTTFSLKTKSIRKAAEASSSMPGVAGFDAQDATRAARWLAMGKASA